MAFCMFAKVSLENMSVSAVLSYLEFLVENEVSVNMVKTTFQPLGLCQLFMICSFQPGNTPKSDIL